MLWWWLWWTKDEFIRTLNQDPLIESLDNFHMRKENKFLHLLCCDTWNHLFQPQKIQRRAPTHFILSNFIATTYTLHNLHLSVFASPNTAPSFDNIKVKGRRCIGHAQPLVFHSWCLVDFSLSAPFCPRSLTFCHSTSANVKLIPYLVFEVLDCAK